MSFSYRVKNQLKILHAHYHVIQTSLWHELMTIKEKKKKLQGLKIAWIGDGNNVCNSLIYGCSKSGINISIATPKGFEPDRQVIKKSKMNFEIETITNPEIAIKNTELVTSCQFLCTVFLLKEDTKSQVLLLTVHNLWCGTKQKIDYILKKLFWCRY